MICIATQRGVPSEAAGGGFGMLRPKRRRRAWIGAVSWKSARWYTECGLVSRRGVIDAGPSLRGSCRRAFEFKPVTYLSKQANSNYPMGSVNGGID